MNTLDWPEFARKFLLDWARSCSVFTAEQAWAHVESLIGPPYSPNVKGALFNDALVKQGFVIQVGYAGMKAVKSHGRKTPLWKSTLVPANDELVPLQTTLSDLQAKVHSRRITLMEALRKAYELGSQTTLS